MRSALTFQQSAISEFPIFKGQRMRPFLLWFLLFLFISVPALGQMPSEREGSEFSERGGLGFQEPNRGMGPMPPPLVDWIRELNLSPEQTARLREVRQSYLRDTLAWRDELLIKRFDLGDLWERPQVDPDQILAKQREISELESKIQERVVLYQFEMRRVLTPDQLKLLAPVPGFNGFPVRRMHQGYGRGPGRQ
jgi:Spy/CpxP family protein refolding chaperone